MKQKKQSPTRSESARHNGRAGNDTNPPRKPYEDYLRFYVSMPAWAFEKMATRVAELEKKQH
jgi:hypothetical protein